MKPSSSEAQKVARAKLGELEEQEGAISARRAVLIAEIDELRLKTPRTDAQSARIAELEAEESALSLERRTLQHLIDGLRLRLRMPQGPRT